MLETITDQGTVIAIIVSHRFHRPGVHFVTDPSYSQQLAYIQHPAGQVIEPHTHNPVRREVHHTQEVLVIQKGRLQVDFYNEMKSYLESRVLEAGDTLILVSGGHGFHVLESVEMVEVKQGPYAGDADKTRFTGVAASDVMLFDAK